MFGIILPEDDSLVDEPRPIKTWILVLSSFLVAWSLIVYGVILIAVAVPRAICWIWRRSASANHVGARLLQVQCRTCINWSGPIGLHVAV